MLPLLAQADEDDNDSHRQLMMKLFLLLLLSHSRKKKVRIRFHSKLNMEGRRRRQRGLVRGSLLEPSKSPWAKLCGSAHDGAMITVTGFDFATFQYLLQLVTPFFLGHTPWCGKQDGFTYKKKKITEKRGRKRIVDLAACLGLVLAWYRFNGGEFTLQGWFGFTGGHANLWLRFGRRMPLKALQNVEEAKVHVPSDEMVEFCKEAVHQRHSSLKNVHCFADGLKLNFESCGDPLEQGMFCNGWTHGHHVTNLFVFSATGRITDSVMNVLGSTHDSTLAVWGGIHRRLKEVHDRTGGVCAVDSAFAANDKPYLIGSSKDINKARSAAEIVKITEATSLWQAAEWGMRAAQGSMPRLKEPIHCEINGERKRIIKLVPLLYNVRLARVGLSQIANTHVPNWSRDSSHCIKKINTQTSP